MLRIENKIKEKRIIEINLIREVVYDIFLPNPKESLNLLIKFIKFSKNYIFAYQTRK